MKRFFFQLPIIASYHIEITKPAGLHTSLTNCRSHVKSVSLWKVAQLKIAKCNLEEYVTHFPAYQEYALADRTIERLL